jgi:hypothetical protein
MDNSELTWIVLAIALVATLIGRIMVRRRALTVRPIPAYIVLPETAADAVESDNRVHFSMGSSGVGSAGTVSALVSAEVIYRMSERLAINPRMPLVTLSDPLTLPLAQDTLRRAYESRGRLASFRSAAAAWFPQGGRSLAFAAGASSLAADADVYSSILLGRYGFEMALLGESALRHDQTLIAHSDLVEGQAIAFAQADHVLIGEELYVAPAYMGDGLLAQGGVIALDFLRWLVIAGIVVAALQSL